MISFGPYICRVGEKGMFGRDVENTGYCVEFSSSGVDFRFPIYRGIRSWKPEVSDFRVFMIHENDIPFSISYLKFFSVTNEKGLFIPLEIVISKLYGSYEISRSIGDFLNEFHEVLPFSSDTQHRIPGGDCFVDHSLASQGIELADAFSYGRSITVSLIWVAKGSRSISHRDAGVYAAGLEFRPRPNRTLGLAKWLQPSETLLAFVFTRQFSRIFHSNPTDLLSKAGQEFILSKFEWTKLSLMTAEEAKLARINFARSHPELLEKPKELAAALKKAELYSDSTSVSQILKHLPSIIRAAQST